MPGAAVELVVIVVCRRILAGEFWDAPNGGATHRFHETAMTINSDGQAEAKEDGEAEHSSED